MKSEEEKESRDPDDVYPEAVHDPSSSVGIKPFSSKMCVLTSPAVEQLTGSVVLPPILHSITFSFVHNKNSLRLLRDTRCSAGCSALRLLCPDAATHYPTRERRSGTDKLGPCNLIRGTLLPSNVEWLLTNSVTMRLCCTCCTRAHSMERFQNHLTF